MWLLIEWFLTALIVLFFVTQVVIPVLLNRPVLPIFRWRTVTKTAAEQQELHEMTHWRNSLANKGEANVDKN